MSPFGIRAKLCAGKIGIDSSIQAQSPGDFMRRKWRSYGNSDTSHFTTPHLRWDEALVLSLSSFHGRGFFTQTITLGDAYARLAVTEAVLGLFIEISFIATFTQRFFGK
jgi:hypothetical protein